MMTFAPRSAPNARDSTPNGNTDSDGVDNATDNSANVANAAQTDTDTDGDGRGDACDSTPNGVPSSGAQCKKDGWKYCGLFKSQGAA